MKHLILLILSVVLSACGGSDSPINTVSAAERPKTIIAFGDSITAGYMPVDGSHQLRQDLSYLQDLKAAGPVITAAVGGATSEQGLGLQAYWLREIRADVVVVMFGINDAVYDVNPVASATHIGRILEQYPGAHHIVIAPPLWSEGTRAKQQALTTILSSQARIWGATYIDLYTPSADLKPWCTADRHPCADWHRQTGAQVLAAIKARG